MSRYVAAYDISDGNRRAAVARILERSGQRVQRSVFEIDVSRDDLADLRREIASHLGAHDAFDLFPVDRRAPERRIRWGQRPNGWDPVRLL